MQVIDFPLAQRPRSSAARPTPPDTAGAAGVDGVGRASGIDKARPHVAAFLPKNTLGRHRFMIPELFDRVMAWPKLPEALYQRLAAYDSNAFMPGVDGIPQDLVMLVQVNQHFIDSFMVGANVSR